MTTSVQEKVLVLRTCKEDMTSHHGFVWPKNGAVEAPDWDPKPECGNGLHGLLWGEGDWSLLRGELTAVWQVVEVDPVDLVNIDTAKVKFRKGTVVFTGEMSKAVTMVLCHQGNFAKMLATAKKTSSGDYSKAASSGDSSTAASSGHSSKAASSGHYSKAASSGHSSKAASSGDYSTAASSGDSSKAASSGHSSKAASSGDYSKAASSGDYSKAAAEGEKTIAMVAGIGGQAKAGKDGCFALAYLDNKERSRILVGHVGEEGIEPDTWYQVSKGKLVKV